MAKVCYVINTQGGKMHTNSSPEQRAKEKGEHDKG